MKLGTISRIKRIISIACLFFVISLLYGCGAKDVNKEKSTSFFAMDTYMSIRIYGGNDELLKEIEEQVRSIEDQVSVTGIDSAVYRLGQTGKAYITQDTYELIKKTLAVCEETDGALDISVYPIVREWGFTVGHYHVPNDSVISELLQKVDFRDIDLSANMISVPKGMEIDLGSVTKGYTADRLSEMIRQAGVTSAVIDLGGNIQTVGNRPDGSPWRIAIKAPDGDALLGILTVTDEAVVTSGGYERFFEDDEGNIWWHIMDPSTGYPAQNGIVSATVVGKAGFRCDALSTALFVMGTEKAIDFWRSKGDFEMLLVTDSGEFLITPELAKRFTPDVSQNYALRVIGYAEN